MTDTWRERGERETERQTEREREREFEQYTGHRKFIALQVMNQQWKCVYWLSSRSEFCDDSY
jgi:hypothetical protein